MYKDPNEAVEKRVEDLLQRMTLAEKLAQLSSDLPMRLFKAGGLLDYANLQRYCRDGLGRITQYSMLGLKSSAEIASCSNRIQHYFVEETRLGIPVILQAESLSGYPAVDGTMFPSMLNAASTFNPDLVEEMGQRIGQEEKAVGIRQALSPLFDIARDPRWGRVYETFGEDPYLVAQMGCAYVRGMQGNKKDGVLATGKHFLGYSETQAGLNLAVTRLNDRELYESFATPFEAGIKEAGLAAIMASYSEIDGLPCGANKKICRDLLRNTLGFEGVLVSDGAAIWKMFNTYNISRDYEEAGLLGLKGGLDTEMPIGAAYRQLGKYIETGELDIALVDEAVRRVLVSKFELGLFEEPYIDESVVAANMTDEIRVELSKKITRQSIVLLKNEAGVLPLDKKKKIALIGPHADAIRPSVSGYTAISYYEMIAAMNTGTDDEPSFNGIMDEKEKEGKDDGYASAFSLANNMLEANFDPEKLLRENYGGTTLYEELQRRFVVSYAKGCDILDDSQAGFAEAVSIAKESDCIILAVGGNCGWTKCTGGEGKDRTSLALPGVQPQLLEALADLGKDIILVLCGPGTYAPRMYPSVRAVLQAWLPGAYGAAALAGILAGEYSPSGKLPMTMPRNAGQIPIFYNHKTGSGYTVVQPKSGQDNIEIFGGGYVDCDKTPLFPFGYGLSYTSFAISNFSVDRDSFSTADTIEVSCTIQNTGSMAGAEVVQLYYHYCEAHVTRPVKQLAAFRRISLMPGEIKRVVFRLDTAQLGFYDEEMDFVVEPGWMDLMLGTSSADLLYTKKIELIGDKVQLAGRRKYTCPVFVEPV